MARLTAEQKWDAYDDRGEDRIRFTDTDLKTLKPTAVVGNWEYWRVDADVYKNRVRTRGPMVPLGNSGGGKPSNAVWERSIARGEDMAKSLEQAYEDLLAAGYSSASARNWLVNKYPQAKVDALVAKKTKGRDAVTREHRTAAKDSDPRRARLHRALDRVLDAHDGGRAKDEARMIARWESKTGKHWVDLYFNPAFKLANGQVIVDAHYRAPGAGGGVQASTEAEAIAAMQRRIDQGGFQPDAAKTSMRRVR